MTAPDRGPSLPRPPAWAEKLLGVLVPGTLRASLLEDVRERFVAMVEKDGPGRARRWYLRQVASAARPGTLWAWWVRGTGSDHPRGGSMGWIGEAGGDARHALRRMRGAPGSTAAAVLMLGIGVGGGTGVYGIHRALQDLTATGLPDPDRVRVLAVRDTAGRLRTDLPAEAAPEVMEALPPGRASMMSVHRRLLRVGGDAQLRAVAAVTPGHFRIMGAPTALGRGIGEDDVGAPVLVLSHGLWRDRLGGDPDVLGSVLHLDRRPHTVVGVAAEGFVDLGFVSAWTPLDLRAASPGGTVPTDAGRRDASTGGGPAPPPALTSVTAVVEVDGDDGPALAGLAARLGPLLARPSGGGGGVPGDVELVAVDELGPTGERGSILSTFGILGALSLLVLLAASANVANLGTAQVLARRRELALRRSLGASRGRIVRLVVTELLILGILAGAGAVAVVAGLTRLIPSWLPPSTADVVEFQVRLGHLWIALALSVVAALLSALLPSLRTPPTDAVLRSGPGSSRGEGPGRAQRGLVVVQVALSALLLASAGLLVRSTTNLRSLDHGLSPAGTSVFTLAFPERLYGSGAVDAFLRETLPDIRALPGVDAGAAVAPAPIIGAAATRIRLPGAAEGIPARRLSVTEDYFRAMGSVLTSGRPPRRDELDAAVVTADLAERLWPGSTPLERRAVVGRRQVRIVGVAEAGVYGTASPQPHVFLPLDASETRNLTLVLRGATGPGTLYPAVRSVIRQWDPDLPVNSLGTLDDLLDRAQILRRATSGLAGLLGALAFLIAVVGLYAHFSHYVASRRRATGVRLAIGAPRLRVLREILVRGLVLTSVGIVAGAALAVVAGELLRSFLFGVTPADPGVLGSVAAVLVLTAAGALVVPARRAAAVDPMAVLREE